MNTTVAEKTVTTDWACNVAIVGRSGTGKTTSIELLPPDKTLIINIENKKLPFKKKFLHEYRIKDYRELVGDNNDGMLINGISSNKFDYIVIDSFTTWAEMLLDFCKKYETGYDIYKKFLSLLRKSFQLYFIPEYIQKIIQQSISLKHRLMG
jgi:septin family protein